MKPHAKRSRVLPLILGLVGAYVLFVVVVVLLWEPGNGGPDDLDWDDRQRHNVATMAQLELGMTRSEVVTLLGSPDFSEAFEDGDGHNLQILRYRTHRTKGDGLTTLDETTPLLFQDDRLTAWGNTALSAVTD
ncbi:DUF3192 domain-containing protein [Ferrimonas gelatinilytica]